MMIGHTIRFEEGQWEQFTRWVSQDRQNNFDPGGGAEMIRRWVSCWIEMREKEANKS